jgi:maltose alpha-D-glucosyltransferase/alpha-amylase
MLLSLPGSPVLYYGDEIAMGDNIYLGDRDGVRTPMQWTPDRNAGFSDADFAQLYLPPLVDPVYGYQAVNVEAQQRDPSSFLRWVRRMLQVRKQHHAVFGRGSLRVLEVENPAVLAYIRELDDEVMLCVNNLGGVAQPAELPLQDFLGRVPVERLGGTPFPPVQLTPYIVTMPAHAFFWFRLEDA